ncbi:hypothetical protein BCON_0424g00030 [Botryotinia convoluta]|uniref:Uncharacterized protein n=1 Tax=Botryotinia convoluta TaxID=54673 RepID=A0A4Z1H7M9_9HELO|nr:hypothetical protein BCON_0424g00030 [Botryotinia convoluta]
MVIPNQEMHSIQNIPSNTQLNPSSRIHDTQHNHDNSFIHLFIKSFLLIMEDISVPAASARIVLHVAIPAA